MSHTKSIFVVQLLQAFYTLLMDLQRKQNYVGEQISLVSETRNFRNQRNLGLVLLAKPRLKWTEELHQHFVKAVSQLGGAENATPKALMQVMGVPGLSLFHLKSHLQKYRLAQTEQSETSSGSEKEDFTVANKGNTEIGGKHINGENISQTHKQITESMQIARSLQMQLYMQKKLHEHIEEQLQLRIEAQTKYLQSVLKKAQETFFKHNSPAMGIDNAKAELLELISTVGTECPGSSVSQLTEKEAKRLLDSSSFGSHQSQLTDCSIDSCLTSSEISERLQKLHMEPSYYSSDYEARLFSQETREKRKFRAMSAETSVEQPTSKRSLHHEQSENHSRKLALWEEFDLNS